MTKPIGDTSQVLPRRFPPLVGLVVAALLGGGLVAAGESGLLPRGWWDGTGRWMAIIHGMTAFAIVVLLGDRLALASWSASLRDHGRGEDDGPRSDWVGRAYEMSRRFLKVTPSSAEREAAIAKVRAALERDLAKRWRVPRDLAFVIPVVGLLLMLYKMHLIPLARQWSEVGLPMAVAVIEATAVVLVANWTAREGRSILSAWEDQAVAISRVRPSEGLIQEDDPEEEVPEETGAVDPSPPDPPPPPDPPTPKREPEEPRTKKTRDRSGKGIYHKK